ncbi:kynureninase [Bacteroidota bacterium]
MKMNFSTDLNCAEELDKKDELKEYKEKFFFDNSELIYLDGNSLGRLPVDTIDELGQTIKKEWGRDLISSWNKSWIDLPASIGNQLAKIIGAGGDEVIISDSTSVNLFKLVTASLKSQPGRKKIISDSLNFPSDLYIMQGIIDMIDEGHYLELIPSHDEVSIDQNELINSIDSNTALVCLCHVAFRTSFMYDMQKITDAAHKSGALIIWDLCHSAGAVPVELNNCGADMAVGCTYKYLNAGPGSPAFLYVRKDLHKTLNQPVWGWLGSEDPFSFNKKYIPSSSIQKFVTGSPPIISMKAISKGLEILNSAGINSLRAKSVKQTEYLIFLAKEKLFQYGFTLGSPGNSMNRGSHVSLCHPESFRINKAMIKSNIIPDFQAPDRIRLGIAPLYNSFTEIYNTIEIMYNIVREKSYETFSLEKENLS